MLELPISGWRVIFRQPAGTEDLLLLEAPELNTRLALDLLARVASLSGEGCDWETLPAGDLETMLLWLRRMVFGDLLRADTACLSPGCGKRVHVSFRIAEYLAHNAPRMPRNVEREGSRFRLRGTDITFRFPTAADQLAVRALPDPARKMARRCIDAPDLPAREHKRIVEALKAMAPSISGPLDGRCPECGVAMQVYFDAQQFVLTELLDQAKSVYRDVHLLASYYHWAEQAVLALPKGRRVQYADLVLGEWRQT